MADARVDQVEEYVVVARGAAVHALRLELQRVSWVGVERAQETSGEERFSGLQLPILHPVPHSPHRHVPHPGVHVLSCGGGGGCC